MINHCCCRGVNVMKACRKLFLMAMTPQRDNWRVAGANVVRRCCRSAVVGRLVLARVALASFLRKVTFLQLSALIVLFYLILSPLDLDAGTVQSATPQLSAG